MMAITVIMGNMGSGKTYLASVLGYAAACSGMDVYANYGLTCAVERIRTYERLAEVRKGLLILDEASFIIDSREFAKNVGLTKWAVLTRKRGLELLLLTQHFDNLDTRIRKITDGLIVMSKRNPIYGVNRSQMQCFATYPNLRRVKSSLLLHSPLIYSMYDTTDEDVLLTGDKNSSAPIARGTR